MHTHCILIFHLIETINTDSSEKVTTGSNSIVKRFGNVEVVVEVKVDPYSFEETFYGFVVGRLFIDRSLFTQG